MSKGRVLIVEDEKHMRVSLMIIIERLGYQVDVAVNGKEALEMIISCHRIGIPYDLILSDIQMPIMGGDLLIEELQKENISIPILVITGFGDKDIVLHLIHSGIKDFINKPFYPKDIEERIVALLESENTNDIDAIRKRYMEKVGK